MPFPRLSLSRLVLLTILAIPATADATSKPQTTAADAQLPSDIVLTADAVNPAAPDYRNEYVLELGFETPIGETEGIAFVGQNFTISSDKSHRGKSSAVWSADAMNADSSANWLILGPVDLHFSDHANLNARVSGDKGSALLVLVSTDGQAFHGVEATMPIADKWLYLNLNLDAVPGLGNICGQPKVWIALTVPQGSASGSAAIDEIKLRLRNDRLPARYSVAAGAQTALLATHDELLRYYAPVIYQRTHQHVPIGDYITRFDYDLNFDARDNWDNLSYDCGADCLPNFTAPCTAARPLPAYVYASVAETQSHVFLQYALFHPADDYKQFGDAIVGGQHENDLEGLVVTIAKDGSEYGLPQLIQVQAHSDFEQYRAPGYYGIYEDEGDIIGDFYYYPGSHNPVVLVESGTHAIRVPSPSEVPTDDRVLYMPGLVAQDPTHMPSGAPVSYALLSISQTFWTQRTNLGMYNTLGDYAGVRFEERGIGLEFAGDTCMTSLGGAHAPWGWSDSDDIAMASGDWYMDPAWYHDWQFDFDRELSLHYESHEYFPTQAPVALPRGKWTVIAHGASFAHDVDDQLTWMLPLARRIRALDGDPEDVVILRANPESFSIRDENDNYDVSMSTITDGSTHKVLLFDWAETSALNWTEIAGDGYAFAAGDALFALLQSYGIGDDIHAFIAHSRGAVVLTECLRRLILASKAVDQVVFVDGEGGFRDNFPDSFKDDRFGVIAGTQVSIRYDNIYSQYNEIDPCHLYTLNLDLGGHPIAEAYNINTGQDYSHSGGSSVFCFLDGDVPPPITDYLLWHMGHNGSRFTFDGYEETRFSGATIDPDSWDTAHISGRASDAQIFNGDFGWGSRAGWKSFGSTTAAKNEKEIIGSVFLLDVLDRAVEHSYAWIPSNARRLKFSYQILSPDMWPRGESLVVSAIPRGGVARELAKIPLYQVCEMREQSLIIPDALKNRACKLRFEIDDDGLLHVIESQVLIDNLTIENEAPTFASADIVECIDRSGSMTGQKIADAKNAAATFVGLMSVGDMIGVTSFNSSSSVNYPLTLIQGQVERDLAISRINAIAAGGGTSIGSGMQASQAQLNASGTAAHAWAIVLLSDGISNGSEYQVLPTIPEATDIYTIGLGAGVDEVVMNDIASQTGGTYHFAPNSQQLQQIYGAIRGQITGQQTVLTSSGVIMPGATNLISDVLIDSGTSQATFSIGWSGSDIDLLLRAPDGSVITPAAADGDPDIYYYEGATFEYFTLTEPEAGIWEMNLIAIDIPSGGEAYTAAVQVNTSLSMDVAFTAATHTVCSPIHLTARLTDSGIPVLGATIEASVDAPLAAVPREFRDAITALDDGVPDGDGFYVPARKSAGSISLFDDGLHGDGEADDGLYGGYFSDTTVQGSYTFRVRATGVGPIAWSFVREDQLATVVSVGAATPPVPQFSTDVDTGPVPLAVQFTDQSAGCISVWSWSFGDGGTSTEQHPNHTFVSVGSFPVTLTVTGPGGATTVVHEIVTTAGGCVWIDDSSPPLDNSGLDGHGVAWGDLDGDGDDDLYLANNGPNKLLRNEGDGVFSEIPHGNGEPSYDSRGATWADFDNDGDLDLYVVNWNGPNVLYRNDAGVLVNATAGDIACPLQGNNAAWADVDGDGDLDVFVTNFDGPNKLLRNDGGGVFTWIASAAGFTDKSRGCAWGDYDNDLDQDLYVSVEDGPNHLFRNDGGVLVDVTVAPLDDLGKGKGVDWGDFDNDGDLDLYLVNRLTENRLFVNDGGVFSISGDPVVADTGDGRSCGWGDYNNDGWLDLFVTNYSGDNKLFHNLHGAFADTTCGDLRMPITAWGMGWNDHDGDGDLDLYVSNHNWQGLPSHMFRNDLITNKSWLSVRLNGTQSNRDGVGARVVATDPATGLTQMREITAGSSYMSQRAAVAQFGMGDASRVNLSIHWPSGIVQVLENQPVNVAVEIAEVTDASDAPLPIKPFQYAVSNHPNPFNPQTRIEFALPIAGGVTLAVYDVDGHLVKTLLADVRYAEGEYSVLWNGTDNGGRRVASGVYFYRFQSGTFSQGGRMVLLK